MPLFGGAGFFDGSGGAAATLAISGTPVTTATQNSVYAGFTVTASGGTSPYTYALVGTWPSGITIDSSTGVVSGTPTESGSFDGLSVRVTDGAGSTADLTAFDLVVAVSTAPYVSIDFLAGTYTINGASYAAADIISDPANIGASGLHTAVSAASGIIGDLLTECEAANWTLVVEYQELYASSTTYIFDLSDGSTQELAIQRDDVVGNILMKAYESSDPSGYREDDDPASGSGPFGSGTHKIALTRTATKFVMSADGRAIVSDTSTPGTFSPTKAGFGGQPDPNGYFGNDCYIRRFWLYEPQADTDLPTLST